MGPSSYSRAELARSKQLAAGVVVLLALLVVVTAPLLHPLPRDLLATHLVALGTAGAASAAALVPWPRSDRRALIVFPVLGMASITLLGAITSGVAAAYAGLFTLAFVYVGMTQPSGTSLALAVPAAPAFLVAAGGTAPSIDISLLAALGAWLVVGETLSARQRSSGREPSPSTAVPVSDALTGLASRHELERVLADITAGDTLVLVDLDDFKAVNERLGHQGGDRVLAEFAACTRQVVRRADVALRYAGEELLLVLGQGGAVGADRTLGRLRAIWASSDRPTFSAGIAVHNGGSPSETLRLADEALFRAKSLGRNQWRYGHLEELSHRSLTSERRARPPSRSV